MGKAKTPAAKLHATQPPAVGWLCVGCGYRWEGADVPATRCPGCARQIIATHNSDDLVAPAFRVVNRVMQ